MREHLRQRDRLGLGLGLRSCRPLPGGIGGIIVIAARVLEEEQHDKEICSGEARDKVPAPGERVERHRAAEVKLRQVEHEQVQGRADERRDPHDHLRDREVFGAGLGRRVIRDEAVAHSAQARGAADEEAPGDDHPRSATAPCSGALATVSWPWVPVLGSLEPPRRDGENAQKTGKNGGKMGEIRP